VDGNIAKSRESRVESKSKKSRKGLRRRTT